MSSVGVYSAPTRLLPRVPACRGFLQLHLQAWHVLLTSAGSPLRTCRWLLQSPSPQLRAQQCWQASQATRMGSSCRWCQFGPPRLRVASGSSISFSKGLVLAFFSSASSVGSARGVMQTTVSSFLFSRPMVVHGSGMQKWPRLF